MGGSVRVSIVGQERCEVREREGFHRRALPVCGSDNPRRTTKGGRQLAKGGQYLKKCERSPSGRWLSYVRCHALPLCGSDHPRRLL